MELLHRRIKVGRLVALLCCLFAFWQFGHSAYLLAKAELAQWLLVRAWQKMRLQPEHGPVPPWPWADAWPMVKLEWLKHDQQWLVLAGASGRNLAFAPSHVSASVMPGDPGVSMIGGHRDSHFNALKAVSVGDLFSIQHISGQEDTFQVTDIAIVDTRETEVVLDTDNAYLLLVSCYPFNAWQAGGPLRYVVITQRVNHSRFNNLQVVDYLAETP